MPGFIQSKAQLRKLFALGARGELKGGTDKAEEMAHEEGHKRLAKLPEYKANGGMIDCPACGYAFGGDVDEDGWDDDPQESWGLEREHARAEDEEEGKHPPLAIAMKRRG